MRQFARKCTKNHYKTITAWACLEGMWHNRRVSLAPEVPSAELEEGRVTVFAVTGHIVTCGQQSDWPSKAGRQTLRNRLELTVFLRRIRLP